MLTSNARERLRSVETVIVDEIHALVSTKRGAHMALSLERLERIVERPLQRIGLSATQRPLDEIARFLGGAAPAAVHGAARPGPATEAPEDGHSRRVRARGGGHAATVTVVDAREPKTLAITVDVPIDDMAKVGQPVEQPSGPAAQGTPVQTIWTAIHPRLLELVRTAPLHADLRQQPAAGRAAGGGPQRARRRAAGARASRLAGPGAADRDRRPAQGRPAARARRHLLARAGHRHGRDRSGRADRVAALGGQRAAAHRPRRAIASTKSARASSSRSSAATSWPARR